MGIRFRCGHCNKKLNIKEKYAGKKGVCPHCSQPVSIPAKQNKSEQTVGADLRSETDPIRDKATEQPLSKSLAAPKPKKVTTSPVRSKPDRSKPSPSETSQSSELELLQPSLSDSNELPTNYIDPILEAPHRVWYVKGDEEKESGPFKGKVLRKKLDSQQIKPHFQVCREDWEDWKLASDVFPELGPMNNHIPVASDSVFTNPNYSIRPAVSAKAKKAQQKKQKMVWGSIALGVGLLITLWLSYLLITLI